MATGDVHVVRGNTGWRVEIEGRSRAQSIHSTQQQAQQTGREIASRTGRELLIHGRNGKIRERSTYGTDPPPTRG
jgi:hypothetical protein